MTIFACLSRNDQVLQYGGLDSSCFSSDSETEFGQDDLGDSWIEESRIHTKVAARKRSFDEIVVGSGESLTELKKPRK